MQESIFTVTIDVHVACSEDSRPRVQNVQAVCSCNISISCNEIKCDFGLIYACFYNMTYDRSVIHQSERSFLTFFIWLIINQHQLHLFMTSGKRLVTYVSCSLRRRRMSRSLRNDRSCVLSCLSSLSVPFYWKTPQWQSK